MDPILTPNSKKYHYPSVLIRFSCRLSQIIALYQREFIHLLVSNDFKNFFKDLSIILTEFHQTFQLCKFLKKIVYLVNQYVEKLQVRDIENQKKFNGIQISLIGKHINQTKKQTILNSSEIALAKLLNGINNNYKIYQGMDLQYNNFRSVVFQAKNRKASLIENCFQRNHQSNQQIAEYSKKYSLYTKKRSMKKNMKLDRLKTENDREGYIKEIDENIKNKVKFPSGNASPYIKRKLEKVGSQYQLQNPQRSLLSSQQFQRYEQLLIALQPSKSKIFERSRKNPLEMKNLLVSGQYFDNNIYSRENIPKNTLHPNRKGSIFLTKFYQSTNKRPVLRKIRQKNRYSITQPHQIIN